MVIIHFLHARASSIFEEKKWSKYQIPSDPVDE